VRAILRWGNISDGELADHENNIRRWGVSSVGLNLTERQLAALIERGRGWPWNGYELRLMKEAGKYPPTRLKEADVSLLRFSFGGVPDGGHVGQSASTVVGGSRPQAEIILTLFGFPTLSM
jgi:hypothetical protein